jgi:hypothetical protein
MKVTIKTDDAYEIQGLMNAENFRGALCDFGNYLRPMALGKVDKIDSLDEIYERFFEIMDENCIDREMVGF